MKFKLCSFAFMLFLFIVMFPVYYTQQPLILKVQTDSPDKSVVLEYTAEKKEAKTNLSGIAEFAVPPEKVKSFSLQLPEKTEIKEIVLKGRIRQELSSEGKLTFENLNTEARRKLNKTGLLKTVILECLLLGFLFFIKDILLWKKTAGKNTGGKMLNIELLRIFFTLGVVCCHFFGSLNLYTHGVFGVEFFFILSGYFLAYTYKPDKSTTDFIKSKFMRFVPLVVFGSLICGGGLSAAENLFFLQNTGLTTHDTVNAPAWYIGVLFWVLVFYFMLLKTVSAEAAKLLTGIIIFCSFVFCVGAGGDRLNFAVSYIPRGMFRGLGGVGLGYLLYQFCKRPEENHAEGKLYSLGEFGFVVFMAVQMFKPLSFWQDWIFQPIEFAVLICLFVCKKGMLSNFLERPVFAFLAEYCLAVYLTHWFVMQHWKEFIDISQGWAAEHRWGVVFIVLAVCWLFGIFAHHVIEKPAANILKKLLHRRI